MNTASTTSDPRLMAHAKRLALIAGALAAIAAAAGLFVPNIYRDSEGWIRQARAADFVTLFAVVPVLAVASWQASRGSFAGRFIGLAAVGYLIYNYAIFGFAVAINVMTPIHIAVLGLSAWSLGLSLLAIAAEWRRPVTAQLPRRASAALLLAVACLFGLMWLGQIAQAITAGQRSDDLTRLGLVTNPIYTLDLAFALPFMAVAAVLLLRQHPNSDAVGFTALSWSALMGLGVLAIFAFDALAGAAVPVPVVALIALITVLGIVLLLLGLRTQRIAVGPAPVARQGLRFIRQGSSVHPIRSRRQACARPDAHTVRTA